MSTTVAGRRGVCLGRPDLVGKIWIKKGYRVSLRRPLRWRLYFGAALDGFVTTCFGNWPLHRDFIGEVELS